MLVVRAVFLWVSVNCIDIVRIEKNGKALIGRKLGTFLNGKPYMVFYNIPYAAPPLGELRFKPPKSTLPYKNGSYNYTDNDENHCTQLLNEDCLYLTVFVPMLTQHQTLPVMVWVHENSYDHEPDFLLEENVIVIKVSYRTGIFGFLNTGDDFAQGNMGAKDILAALRWLKENLFLFDGDANRITVFGSGEAANVVAAILLSAAANDLFARVIVQSGSALSILDDKHLLEIPNKLYWRLTETTGKVNRTKLYELLIKASTDHLTAISISLFDSTEVRDSQRLIKPFGITVEISKNSESFITRPPIKSYDRQLANKDVEVMMGYTNLELKNKLFGLSENRRLLRHLNYNFQYLLPFEGKNDVYGSKRYRVIRREILNFYFLNGTITERSFRRYAKYVSDQMVYPVIRQARLQATLSFVNIYLYRFSYNGSMNLQRQDFGDNLNAATTGDEICYLFRCKSANHVYSEAKGYKEIEFIKRVAMLWTNFAKFGNPTPLSQGEGLLWIPLAHSGDIEVMMLKNSMRMSKAPETKRIEFWDKLREKYFVEKSIIHDEL